jgi:nucleolar protein 53
MDPTEFPSGSAIFELSEAVKKSGSYDPWLVEVEEEGEDDFAPSKKSKVKVRSPQLSN